MYQLQLHVLAIHMLYTWTLALHGIASTSSHKSLLRSPYMQYTVAVVAYHVQLVEVASYSCHDVRHVISDIISHVTVCVTAWRVTVAAANTTRTAAVIAVLLMCAAQCSRVRRCCVFDPAQLYLRLS
jgi:hypothetical protein